MISYRSLEFLIETIKTQRIFFDDFLKYDPDDIIDKHEKSYFVTKIGEMIKKLSNLNVNVIFFQNQRDIISCISKIIELLSLILQREDVRSKLLDEIKNYVLNDLLNLVYKLLNERKNRFDNL